MVQMTVNEAIKACIEQAEQERAKRTAYTYSRALVIFKEFLAKHEIVGSSPVEALDVMVFVRYPNWLMRLSIKKATAVTYMAGVNFFFDWLVYNGYLKPDYREGLLYNKAKEGMNKKREDHFVRTPAKGDADKMRETVRSLEKGSPEKERDIALVEFLFSSGCRIGEAVGLNVEDFDMNERQVIVSGKGDKERFVFFSAEAAEALTTYWKVRKSGVMSGPAFARHDRGAGKKKPLQPITTRTGQNIIDDVEMIAGLKGLFTPHYFRHAFAINALNKTGDLALVQDLLGHSSPVTTRVYAKIYPEDLKAAHHKLYEDKK